MYELAQSRIQQSFAAVCQSTACFVLKLSVLSIGVHTRHPLRGELVVVTIKETRNPAIRARTLGNCRGEIAYHMPCRWQATGCKLFYIFDKLYFLLYGEFALVVVGDASGDLHTSMRARQCVAINTMFFCNMCTYKFLFWLQSTNLFKRIINSWHGC